MKPFETQSPHSLLPAPYFAMKFDFLQNWTKLNKLYIDKLRPIDLYPLQKKFATNGFVQSPLELRTENTFQILEDLVEKFPCGQYRIQLDQRIIGYAATLRTSANIDHLVQPTEPIDPVDISDDLSLDKDAPRLWIVDIAMGGTQTPKQNIQNVLQQSGLNQMFITGCDRCICPVQFRVPDEINFDMTPEAYLQQVYHESLVDKRLTPIFQMGFQLAGFHRQPDGEHLVAYTYSDNER